MWTADSKCYRLSSEVYKHVGVWVLVKVFGVGERDGLT